ncbi:hypothetical protein [Kordia sp.]|uniref:hypothetical protein n=1 Tax=Kordia sp. TaxID=1965332 RepID=UPI003B59E66E
MEETSKELKSILGEEALKNLPITTQLMKKMKMNEDPNSIMAFFKSDFHGSDMHRDAGQYKPISTIHNE